MNGTAKIFGSNLTGLNRQAGYLFQAEALFPWKTALENVAIGLEIAGTPKAEARGARRDWLTRVGIGGFGDRYPHMLSGGQRKRVGLVQVLIRDPKILLMDEPFGPLDAQTRQIMGNLLLDLWSADRKAVLFVTHDLEEAIALSDRVVIMSAGPAARIIGNWKVPLSRPRDIGEVKLDPAFHALHREIWEALKDEVMKGYAQTGEGDHEPRNASRAANPGRDRLLVAARGMYLCDLCRSRERVTCCRRSSSPRRARSRRASSNGSSTARSGAICGSRWSRRCSPSSSARSAAC